MLTRRLYPLQDARDRRASRLVRAAVVLSDAQVGDLLDLTAETGRVRKGGARLVTRNGLSQPNPPLAEAALAALRKPGREPAESLVFVMPPSPAIRARGTRGSVSSRVRAAR